MTSTPVPTQNKTEPSTSHRVALEMSSVTAGYGETTVLRSVDFQVRAGTVVALLGPNGAGKTTALKTAAGLLRLTSGRIELFGDDVSTSAAHRRARAGLCLIPEGRGVFPALTVAENLRMQLPPWSSDRSGIDRALTAFPDLKGRLSQLAGSMSGGQQQMLALSRAYVAQQPLVLLDEVSLGLAPRVVDTMFIALRDLAAQGVALLLVEQYVTRALEIADQVLLLDKGQVSFAGPATELEEAALLSSYFGLQDESS